VNNLTKIVFATLWGGLLYFGYDWYTQKTNLALLTEKKSENLKVLAFSEPEKCIQLLTDYWNKDEITYDELLFLIELLLESPIRSPSPKLIEDLETLASQDPDAQVLSACFEFEKGNTLSSIDRLNRLCMENPKNKRAGFEFHKILWTTGGLADRIRAKVALKNLASYEDRWSYKALRVLCFTPPRAGLIREDIMQFLADLKSHPLVTSRDFLKCIDIQIASEEDFDLENAVLESTDRIGNPLKEEDFGTWLIQKVRPFEAVKLVTEQIALKNSLGFFARFQGLLETNQTKKAKDLLSLCKTRLTDEEQLRAQTYWSIAVGKKEPFVDFFDGAKSLNSAQSCLDVARLALLSKKIDFCNLAFQEAWKINPDAFGLDQANQFLQLSLLQRDTKQAHEISKGLLRRFPYKFGNANNYCYLTLLLGGKDIEMENEAERIISSFPGNPTFLSTLALAKLKNGKYQEAYKAMERRRSERFLPGERALLAAILSQVEKREEALRISKSLSEQRMLPEEWEMLHDFDLIAK